MDQRTTIELRGVYTYDDTPSYNWFYQYRRHSFHALINRKEAGRPLE